MSGPGRPTLYTSEHADRSRELCARGATNPDLASPETGAYIAWLRNRRPEDGRAKPEPTPEAVIDDTALLDAASERAPCRQWR